MVRFSTPWGGRCDDLSCSLADALDQCCGTQTRVRGPRGGAGFSGKVITGSLLPHRIHPPFWSGFFVFFWFQVFTFLQALKKPKKTSEFQTVVLLFCLFFCLFGFWGKYNVNMTSTITTISYLFWSVCNVVGCLWKNTCFRHRKSNALQVGSGLNGSMAQKLGFARALAHQWKICLQFLQSRNWHPNFVPQCELKDKVTYWSLPSIYNTFFAHFWWFARFLTHQ